MTTTPEQILEALRARIDALDDQMIALLKERVGVVQQVAQLKGQYWPNQCHIRSGREGRMHQRIAQAFAGSDFPARAALAIWRQIIGVSTHVESPLRIAVTSAHQAMLARDYFGSSAQIMIHASLADALAAMAAQRCTIVLADTAALPVARAMVPALHIFAALPLIADAQPVTLALAAITPEASGDDVSYYLADGRIQVRDGFVPDAQWLGAHPRPLRLQEPS